MNLEEYYNNIYRYRYLHTQNRHTAEDLTQETFLKFLETSNYQDRGKPLAFLYTIARNLCIDHIRQDHGPVPFLALATVSEAGYSARCGMEELELSTRFSLHVVLCARLGILGTENLLLLGILLPFGVCLWEADLVLLPCQADLSHGKPAGAPARPVLRHIPCILAVRTIPVSAPERMLRPGRLPHIPQVAGRRAIITGPGSFH